MFLCVISRNRLQSEEIVSELVYSFLIPEIEKMSLRQRGIIIVIMVVVVVVVVKILISF